MAKLQPKPHPPAFKAGCKREDEEEEGAGTEGVSMRRQRSSTGIAFHSALTTAAPQRVRPPPPCMGARLSLSWGVSVFILEEGGGKGGDTVLTIKNQPKIAALANETMWYSIALGKFLSGRPS
jgi:hypothetical protein